MSQYLCQIKSDISDFKDNFILVFQVDPWCHRWPHLPRLQSGTFSVLQVSTSRTGGSWHTSISNHARELKFGTKVNNCISWRYMMSRMTPSSITPVRNHQCPPSITSRTGGSWYTSNHAREFKFGTQVKDHILWWYMMSRMFWSSKSSVRNLKCPPSMTSGLHPRFRTATVWKIWKNYFEKFGIFPFSTFCPQTPPPPPVIWGWQIYNQILVKRRHNI